MSDAAEETKKEEAAPPPEVVDDGPPESLLAPLPGEEPCGENLRYEGTFDAIREHRRDEDPNLPQGVWETDVKRADWGAVDRLCQDALSKKSKDLHLALWLTEAWTHEEGLRGFRRGIDLTCSLIEEYWPDIHPKIDDDGDLDYRLGPLRWASEQFPIMLRLVKITAPAGADAQPMSIKNWEDVLRIENLKQRDPNAATKEQKRYFNRTQFEASVELTPVEYYIHLVGVAEACLGELERLDLLLEEHCPKESPSLARIRSVLQDIESRARGWMEQKGGVLPGDVEEVEDAAESAATESQEAPDMASETKAQPATGPAGPIQSRAEAYQRLSEAADYLIRTEPHSPVPYLVKRAVTWGNMSFGELLVELVEGGGDHQRVLRLLGLDAVGKKTKEN
ncbi:MAG: type VI secretion system protein TssA [Alphaproteobacteria bacterium]|uniref:type VI secretion system protein TssA n=1 Tax=Pacificispira sp. TaxID=2888761 RepID=UPI0032F0DF02